MITESIEIGIIVERRVLSSRWAEHAWMPVAVLAGAPAALPWTVLQETAEATRYYAGTCHLDFFASETTMYRENLRSGRPSLWVALRPSDASPGVTLRLVTADPAESEALTEPGTDIIEAVPMPPEIRNRLAAFVEAHHVERPFVKRKRDRPDPEVLGRRPPVLGSRKDER